MAAHAPFALRVTPESHIHPSIREAFADAEVVERTLAALPPDADPSVVHVVSWTVEGKRGHTSLRRVAEDDVTLLGVRGTRAIPSRLVLGVGPTVTSTVTVVVGPHEDLPTVYTAYWGTPAPREPGDPSLDDAGREEAEAFWSAHALVPERGEQTVVNLTPHEIVAGEGPDARRIPPSGLVARVEERSVLTDEVVAGLPVMRTEHGAVTDLPAAQCGVIYVVSGFVRGALGPARPDVVSPSNLIRDEDGRVVGCRAFVGADA